MSNLPYSVASPILVELAQVAQPPERMVATLQLEVVRRLVAEAGSADYGVLTLLVQVSFQPGGWFKIPAGCFFPEPEVDSACVTLTRRDRFPLEEEQIPSFVSIIKRSFSQRRKMMMKLLRTDWSGDHLEEAFAALGLEHTLRAEALSLDQFIQLTRHLHGRGRTPGSAGPATMKTPRAPLSTRREKQGFV